MALTDFTDSELGHIHFHSNPRARRLIFRCLSKREWHITHPPTLTQQELDQALHTLRPRLLKQQEQLPDIKYIDETFTLQSPYFHLAIQCIESDHFQLRREEFNDKCQYIKILVPYTANLKDNKTQEFFRKVIIQLLRERAHQTLPPLLKKLAQRYKFHYHKVNIHHTHSCWGSCSGRGTINLSLYLMLLPYELVEYVLIHELCHTVEMNHSERFWALLDDCTSGQSGLLRKELKKYHTTF